MSIEDDIKVERLENALRDIIAANCCGCSVYANIACAALGILMGSSDDVDIQNHWCAETHTFRRPGPLTL